FLGEAPFQKRARINSGSGVALNVNNVAFKFRRAGAEEMVETDFVQRGSGSIGGNMAADVVLFAIRAHHHGDRVPTDQALYAPLELLVAREIRLHATRNGVDVGRLRGEGNLDAHQLGVRFQPLQNVRGHFRTARLQDGVERFKPLLNFGAV